ncbi:hypothetical protein MMSR116_29390 [Methylobacterium mesophilicum SR1.6/6]|uniref:Uncharacterized protein n=1 Tax=Methylobacterium mesophilicum SR1.6/6 TaxID=908290 RepID=A0A6B9FSH1_9HYPH|nr:hypothetical protein [Methylobacterium mesophilicum]QGY05551.1 hypothetical protein MMSR116_29390 [Methylobacterium mesophilicum SR1.6/6]
MSNGANLLPARLREAAAAIARNRNARGLPNGAPARADILDLLPPGLFSEVVEDAMAALDAAAIFTPQPGKPSADPAERRVILAAASVLDLDAQAAVLLDIARDGTVTVSTYAEQPGTPAKAIAEWAEGLWRHAISVVPFRTVFGWGRDGVPTPLTPEERASLGEAGRAYADRNSLGDAS